MASFLTLCQSVASESGTIPGDANPATVSAQTGRLRRVVHWTRDAYKDIQRHRPNWRWLQAEFTGQTIAGVASYDSEAMGITERFSHWLSEQDRGDSDLFVYKTSDGVGRQQPMLFRDWDYMYRTLSRGTVNTGKPCYFSISPENKLHFYPTPDDTYTIVGRYYKSPQVLDSDDDEPEMPGQFHDLIKWRALIKLLTYDESYQQISLYDREASKMMGELEKRQLPRIKKTGPLA